MRKSRCLVPQEAYNDFVKSQLSKTGSGAGNDDDWGANRDEFMRCRAGRSTFWVNWEGNMTACGMLDFPIKVKPFENPFLDCWNTLTDCVRSTPVLKGCAGCDKREICKPCVAMVYGETGTVDQKAPYMCQLTDAILTQMKEELEEAHHA